MRITKTSRLNRNGKSPREKEDYRRFIASGFKLDKTGPDPINTSKTDESSSKEEEVPKTEKPLKKSLKLVVKDFFSNNVANSIITSIIAAAVIGIFSFLVNVHTNLKIQELKTSEIEKDVQNIKSTNIEEQNGLAQIEKKFEIFKIEISKDIEFIKDKISNLNKQ